MTSYRDNPDYQDPADGLDEMKMEKLETLLWIAESTATDPDATRRHRHTCDTAIRLISAEIARRKEARE
jgi:hypothetical protein